MPIGQHLYQALTDKTEGHWEPNGIGWTYYPSDQECEDATHDFHLVLSGVLECSRCNRAIEEEGVPKALLDLTLADEKLNDLDTDDETLDAADEKE
jgi:hypothetical protein